jgi:hypothetical protein
MELNMVIKSGKLKIIMELNDMIGYFRPAFSRQKSFDNFKRILVGFILRDDIKGVTDFVRIGYDADENPNALYHRVDKFFRSSSFELNKLRDLWSLFLGKECNDAVVIDGRRVIIGDGVKQGKSGRKMPGVKRYSQSSESMAKPSMIWGHLFGAIGLLTGDLSGKMFCTPINADIEDGVHTIKKWVNKDYIKKSHVVQMVDQGIKVLKETEHSYFYALDRYFLSREVIKTIATVNYEDKASPNKSKNSIVIVTKLKRNGIGYEDPLKVEGPKKRGRPRLKGNSIKLYDLFKDEKDNFKEAEMYMYGKTQKVRYFVKDCLWGLNYYRKMRFVLVETGKLRSILVSSDITIDAKTIVQVYSTRWKCEEQFLRAKHVLGSFDYHFWTKSLPKLNHFRKAKDRDPVDLIESPVEQKKIINTLRAIEVYTFIGQVAQGMLQLLSLKSRQLELKTKKWLRTYSSTTNSEQTMAFDIKETIKMGFPKNKFVGNPLKILNAVS